MNPVVEWGATTAAGTGRPDRVALGVCMCVFVCGCVRIGVAGGGGYG